MLNDIAIYSLGATRPAIRPAAGRTGQEELGPRAEQRGADRARSSARAETAAPALGDDKAARDLARLAKRYALAARQAGRAGG